MCDWAHLNEFALSKMQQRATEHRTPHEKNRRLLTFFFLTTMAESSHRLRVIERNGEALSVAVLSPTRQAIWSRFDRATQFEPLRYNFLVNRDGLHEVCVSNRDATEHVALVQLRIQRLPSANDSLSSPPVAHAASLFAGDAVDPVIEYLGIPSLSVVDNIHSDITILALDLARILDDQRATRMRLNQRREISEHTNHSVLFYSSAEFIVTLICAAVQLLHVRRLFGKQRAANNATPPAAAPPAPIGPKSD